MSLKLKPLGICALRRRPEATGLSKVNVIPGMGTACPSGPGASLAWLTETEPQPSSKARMIFTVTWDMMRYRVTGVKGAWERMHLLMREFIRDFLKVTPEPRLER